MKQRILRLLRVSERPQLPPGDPGTIECFRASPAHLRYSAILWLFKQAGAAAALFASLAFFGGLETPIPLPGSSRILETIEDVEVPLGQLTLDLESILTLGEWIAVAAFLAQMIFTGALLKVAWELRWYMVGDDVLRIREGLWHLREQTMTIANIQNLVIRQGPLQRLFGISDLIVRTAGGGSGDEADDTAGRSGRASLHTGHIRGVDHAHEIRTRIQRRLRDLRGAGLGNEDSPGSSVAPGPDASQVAAASALLAELRGLRGDLTDA